MIEEFHHLQNVNLIKNKCTKLQYLEIFMIYSVIFIVKKSRSDEVLK